MKRTMIAVALSVLGFGASAASANPTLDELPNPQWRNAPETTAVQSGTFASKLRPAYEQEQAYYWTA